MYPNDPDMDRFFRAVLVIQVLSTLIVIYLCSKVVSVLF